MPLESVASLRHAETEDDLRACWPVMQQLRPHIPSADDFIARVSRMRRQAYRLLAVWRGDEALALAGYRLQENLVYGRFLYLDDLVTHESARGEKWGARLVEAMARTAGEAGCVNFVLDTGLSNARAQRFYFREGLLSSALRFSRPITPLASLATNETA